MRNLLSAASLVMLLLTLLVVIGSCKSKQKATVTSFNIAQYVNDDPDAIPAVCGTRLDYAPSNDFPEHTPIQKVRVNMHFLYDEKGGVGLRKSDTRQFVNELIRRSNGYLGQNVQMRLPWSNDTEVLPIRYQYVLTGDPDKPSDEGIYHHTHPTLCYFKYDVPGKRNSHFNNDVYEEFGVQKKDVLNVFFLELHPDSIGKKNYKTPKGIGGSRWVKMGAVNRQYSRKWINEPDGPSQLGEFSSRLLNHEIGHSLGLSHTWNSNDGCDDTPKNDNCWAPGHPKSCPENKASNNVMDYNKWSQAYTPCQLGKIHYNMAKLGSSQRGLLVPQWCDYNKRSSIVIKSNADWSSSKDLSGDVIIRNGATLTISCRLALAAGARIVVEPKGRLIVDGGIITNVCGDKWGGIELLQQGSSVGEVQFLGDAFVSNVAL